MNREEAFRIEQLERRVGRLERRLLRLEGASPAEPARPLPPPVQPPPVVLPPMPTPPDAPPPAWVMHPVPPTAPEAQPRAAAERRGAVPGWTTARRGWDTPRVWAEPAAAAGQEPAAIEREQAPAPQYDWPAPEPADARAARPPISLKDLEERFAGRALAWVGGFALVAAAIFFLSLAFSRGWINHPMRVLIGLAVGMAAFTAGGWFLARANALMGNVLTAVGLGIFSIALFAATRLYTLVIPEIGLAGALVAAIAAAAIAIRFNAREVAAFGLIAALIAPPVVGASPTLLTLGFVAVTLVGTTAIALFRSWRWLPAIAFILAAPQLASWLLGDADPSQALIALAGFWLVNVVAAAGEEVRVRRDDLRPSSATLVLANATFLLWGGFVVLTGNLEEWRGTFLGIASLAHLVLASWFLRRQGMEHLFGNLLGGTGVALLAIAAFVQLGAPAVPLAWAAEAVALTWLAVRRRHRWSAAAGLVLGALTVAHIVFLEYPLHHGGIPASVPFATAFLHPEAASLAAVLLALAVTVLIVPVRWIRTALAALGVLLAAHAVTFEVTGPALAAALTALAIAGLLLDRLVERLPTTEDLQPVAGWTRFGWFASAAGVVAGAMAIALLFATEYPPRLQGVLFDPAFLHAAAASLAIVLAGLVVVGALVGVRWVRSGLAAIGVLLVAWALGFEVTGVALVAMLVVLLPAGVIVERGLALLPEDRRFAPLAASVPFVPFTVAAGALAWTVAALYAVGRFLDPMDWGRVTPPGVPFSDERALVGALLVAGALAAARWVGDVALRRVAIVAAIAAAAVVVPFEVYADGVVVLWVALAAIAIVATRWDARGAMVLTGLASLLATGAAIVALVIVAAPSRLWVVDPAVVHRLPLLAGWPLAFAALAIALYLAPRHWPLAPWRTWFELAAGATAVYLVSIAVVDMFQRMTGGSVAVEELVKQAQVALSVTWTTIGAGALVVGLTRRLPMLRHAGFGLLGLATAKVFVVDLAAMDVAYRALVLAGLGLLLLLSAYLFTRFRGPHSGASGIGGGAHPAS